MNNVERNSFEAKVYADRAIDCSEELDNMQAW